MGTSRAAASDLIFMFFRMCYVETKTVVGCKGTKNIQAERIIPNILSACFVSTIMLFEA